MVSGIAPVGVELKVTRRGSRAGDQPHTSEECHFAFLGGSAALHSDTEELWKWITS